MKKKRRSLSRSPAACSPAVPAFAQSKPIELKLGTIRWSPTPCTWSSLQFADAQWPFPTKGMVKVVIFPNSKLGNSQEILEQVSLGAVDFALPTEPAMAKYVKKFNLVTGPFAFKDYDATDRFFSGGFISWVSPDMERAGFKYLARWEWGFRNYTDLQTARPRSPPRI
jgi:TRAP-type C4-dicarboxylate transport system substrate-binding protein